MLWYGIFYRVCVIVELTFCGNKMVQDRLLTKNIYLGRSNRLNEPMKYSRIYKIWWRRRLLSGNSWSMRRAGGRIQRPPLNHLFINDCQVTNKLLLLSECNFFNFFNKFHNSIETIDFVLSAFSSYTNHIRLSRAGSIKCRARNDTSGREYYEEWTATVQFSKYQYLKRI